VSMLWNLLLVIPGAILSLKDRFNGVPPPKGCDIQDTAITRLTPGTVGVCWIWLL